MGSELLLNIPGDRSGSGGVEAADATDVAALAAAGGTPVLATVDRDHELGYCPLDQV